MRYLGVNINATYSANSTGAYTQDLLTFLKNSCGLTSSSSTLTEFNPLTVLSIFNDPNALILLRASSSTAGHAWIVDGARVLHNGGAIYTVYLHCNYGWDSYCDGYYNMLAFDCTSGPLFTNPNIELGGGRDITLSYGINYAVLKP
jgi:hypothetical protein